MSKTTFVQSNNTQCVHVLLRNACWMLVLLIVLNVWRTACCACQR